VVVLKLSASSSYGNVDPELESVRSKGLIAYISVWRAEYLFVDLFSSGPAIGPVF
jgi:hypothetical protein